MKVTVDFRYSDGRQNRTDLLELRGRAVVDVLAASATAFLQISKYADENLGNVTGFIVGGRDFLMRFNSPAGTATVRVASDADPRQFRKLPLVVLPFQVVVPAGVLREAEDDSVLILQVGAISNALQVVLGWHGRLKRDGGVVASRDLVHFSILIASYVRELKYLLKGKNADRAERLWQLAAKGIDRGRQLPYETLDECRTLLADDSPLLQRLHEIRRLFGFHVLPGVFRDWLSKKANDRPVTLEMVQRPTHADVVFVASAQAIADACKAAGDSPFFADAVRLATSLPYVLEAAIVGLLLEQNFDPLRFFAFDVKAAFTGNSKWDSTAPESGGSQ